MILKNEFFCSAFRLVIYIWIFLNTYNDLLVLLCLYQSYYFFKNSNSQGMKKFLLCELYVLDRSGFYEN